MRRAIGAAKNAGRKVAFTLSDAFVVHRHRAALLGFIEAQVDILFANEEEITMGQGFARLVAGAALAALCCGGAAAQTIVVGGKAFTEQQIMTAMTVALAIGFAGFIYEAYGNNWNGLGLTPDAVDGQLNDGRLAAVNAIASNMRRLWYERPEPMITTPSSRSGASARPDGRPRAAAAARWPDGDRARMVVRCPSPNIAAMPRHAAPATDFEPEFVAGLRAGRVYNSWPDIDGALIPSAARLFFETPWWRNLFDNVLTVQFEHRMTAYALFVLAVLHVLDALMSGANSFCSPLYTRAKRGRPMSYVAAPSRYETMLFRQCGKSGLKLPALSLGLWHNFGDGTHIEKQRGVMINYAGDGIMVAFQSAR